jgi:hypothetical protein
MHTTDVENLLKGYIYDVLLKDESSDVAFFLFDQPGLLPAPASIWSEADSAAILRASE